MTRFADYFTNGVSLGRCVVLPGRQYTPDRPLLSFAGETALMRGWDVRQVWWDPPERGSETVAAEAAWVADQLDTAVGDYAGRVLVVAKSLGTLAATLAAARGYEAAWLTPLLSEPEAAEPLVSYPVSQFILIGSSDPFLDRDVLDLCPGDALVVGGDHILRVLGDPVAMATSHEQFVRSFDRWLTSLPEQQVG